jgi:hypothetical protein
VVNTLQNLGHLPLLNAYLFGIETRVNVREYCGVTESNLEMVRFRPEMWYNTAIGLLHICWCIEEANQIAPVE